MPESSRVRCAVLAAIALSPAAAILASILAYGVDVPWIDEWTAIGSLFEQRALGTLDLYDLTAQHNEHRILLPKLICLALGSFGGWDVRRELLVTFLLAAVTAWNLFALLKSTVGSRTRLWVSVVLVHLLVFSPAQWANWLKGMQMALFLPPLCLTGALRLALSQRGSWVRIGGGMLLCTISTFSVGNGVTCWIAMIPIWLAGSRAKHLVPWLAALAANLALYAYGYQRPRNRLPLLYALEHPLQSMEYFAAFLGAPLVPIFGEDNRLAATLIGSATFLLFLFCCVRFVRTGGSILERALPWIAIGAYSVLTAAMTTLARVGTDKGQPLASRYVTLSLFLGVALVPLGTILVESLPREHIRSRISAGSLALAGFLGVAAVGSWVPSLQAMREERRTHLQGRACLHFARVLQDVPGLSILHARFPGLRNRILALDRGSVFRWPLARSPRAKEVAGETSAPCGSFDHLVRQGDSFMADGRAILPGRDEPADAVLLAYERDDADPTFFAMFLGGPSDDPARWTARFDASKLPPEAVTVSAWAFDALAGKAYRLAGDRPITSRRG